MSRFVTTSGSGLQIRHAQMVKPKSILERACRSTSISGPLSKEDHEQSASRRLCPDRAASEPVAISQSVGREPRVVGNGNLGCGRSDRRFGPLYHVYVGQRLSVDMLKGFRMHLDRRRLVGNALPSPVRR